jgi:hypothetical protein
MLVHISCTATQSTYTPKKDGRLRVRDWREIPTSTSNSLDLGGFDLEQRKQNKENKETQSLASMC